MTIRTEEQLLDRLAADLIWRKKELAIYRTLLNRSRTEMELPLLRASVTLTYAHWEGFIKAASLSYLEFVHFRRLPYRQLAPNFVALGARALFRKAGEARAFRPHLELASFFLSQLDKAGEIPFKDGVATRSNLSSRVLEEIVNVLGLDYGPFEPKAVLIDERLVHHRNTIAHGEYLVLDRQSVDALVDDVLAMLEAFRSQIENAAILKRYAA